VAQLFSLGVIAARLYLFMAKSKKGRNRQKSPPRQVSPPPPPRRDIWRVLSALSPTGWFWASVALLLSFVGSYYLLSSKLSVDPDTSTNPKNAVETFFRFTNQGVLPIYDVYCGMIIHHLKSADGHQSFTDSGMAPQPQNIHILSPGEATTIKIPMLVEIGGAMYSDADIELFYTYKTFLIHHACVGRVRFTTVTDSDGVVHWIHKAINE
jgi:hypothetical protein